jgi:RNA polymerase sigma-70 factor (ECF subfamily)
LTVTTPTSFADFVRRVRAGDPDAAVELVERYEPVMRRAVRIHLEAAGLRRLFDSQDVCQSVFGSFFVRAALGQYDLERPQQLIGLLTTIARNKSVDRARRLAPERRDHVHQALTAGAAAALPAPGPSPSQTVSFEELLRKFRERLTPAERYLAEQRAAGRGWDELAAETDVGSDALRKQLARAIDRVAGQLGVEV